MKNSVSEIYLNDEYADKNSAFGDDEADWKSQNVVKMFERHNLKPKSIVEVGCAGGGILLKVVEKSGEVIRAVGYEPGPKPFALAQSRETEVVKFINDTLTSNVDDDFDIVLCLDVFEHVEDYFEFLRGLKKVGGNYVFHIPLDMNVQMVARQKPIQHVRDKVGHLHYFSKETALESLKHCGYTVEDWFYTCAVESNYNGGFKFKMMNIIRKLLFTISPDVSVRFLGGSSLMVYAK